MGTIKTKTWEILDTTGVSAKDVFSEVAERLLIGEIIAFPTETVYGLGANAFNDAAVDKIFRAKERPVDNPLSVLIAEKEQIYDLVIELDDKSLRLVNHFWPGPLTIVLKHKSGLSPLVTAGLSTVGVRMPANEIALEIIRAAGIPLATTSANSSGRPSPTTAAHVYADLNGKINGIVDGGSTGSGLESTVIDMTSETPTILRPGSITHEELEQVIGEVKLLTKLEHDRVRSPSLNYRHYSPLGEVYLLSGGESLNEIKMLISEQQDRGKRVGLLTLSESYGKYPEAELHLSYGSQLNLYPYAQNLYAALREFDIVGIEYIIVESVIEKGIGFSIMNRLKMIANK